MFRKVYHQSVTLRSRCCDEEAAYLFGERRLLVVSAEETAMMARMRRMTNRCIMVMEPEDVILLEW